jgi:LuxR family maltose regulon positive regulatory protein
MGLGLSTIAIGRLNERTEGWIAGLQMAALSLVGRGDPEGFIESFDGTHRFIVDYLVDEVLLRQSEAVREFLLQTSILQRMTASLCDAVTGRNDGQETLERLDRSNMLLVPLDDRREWYRYHQLFADVLKANAVRQRGAEVSLWHARASRWYEVHGQRTTAISHAFASGDFDLAADLVERTWPELYYGVRPMTWLGWAEQIPGSVASRRPVLTAARAWMLLDKGDLESAEEHLRMTERLLSAERGDVVVSNYGEFDALLGSTEAARAYFALIQEDTGRTIYHAKRGLRLLPEEDHFWHGTASLFVGLAEWREGELKAAYRSIADSVSHQRAAGNYFYEAFGMAILADIRMAQGRLREAQAEYRRILDAGTSAQERNLANAGETTQLIQDPVALHAGLGELNRQWGNLERAEEHLNRGIEIRGRAVLPATTYRLWTARARTRESQGRFAEALADLDEAERRYRPGAVPDPFPIPALRARLRLRQGRLQDAVQWARAGGLGVGAEVPFLREFEYLTWARIAIASASEGRDEPALRECVLLLDRLARRADKVGRSATAIEASILQGIALEKRGAPEAADESIGRALRMAEPEGFIQLFVDEAAVVEPLLARALAGGGNPHFLKAIVRRIRSETGEESSGMGANRLLVEPLSSRELEVLGLINEGRANQAVADELYIALSTVKKHLNNIFGKLGVRSRTEALRRARDLGLL